MKKRLLVCMSILVVIVLAGVLFTSLLNAAESNAQMVTGNPADYEKPHGYAQGTTGGGNAAAITVSSAGAFKSAVSGNSPKVIKVKPMLLRHIAVFR